MAWRFSKRIKIIPGVHLNLSKRGISTTIGGRGASINIGKKGTYLNTGIPGTGISNRTKIGSSIKLPASNHQYPGIHSDTYQVDQLSSKFETYIDESSIDWNLQPKIKGGSLWVIIKGLFIQIIPFGIFIVLYQGLHYINRKSVSIYAMVPNKVVDRRYKENYRIDGFSVRNLNQQRILNPQEISDSKQRGKYYLWSVAVFFLIGYFLYLISWS